MKLEKILLKLAIEVLELTKNNDSLGAPIDRAKQQIYDLLKSELPEKQHIDSCPEDCTAEIHKELNAFNEALDEVEKRLNEVFGVKQ